MDTNIGILEIQSETSLLVISCHFDEIMEKIARAIGVLYRIRPIIPLRILTNLYNTLILLYLSYCNI